MKQRNVLHDEVTTTRRIEGCRAALSSTLLTISTAGTMISDL